MTAIGNEPSEAIWATSAKAATTSRCSPFPVGAKAPVQMSAQHRSGLGAVVGDGAQRGRPGGGGGVDEDESGDLVGEERCERDRCRSTEGVADDDVRSGFSEESSSVWRSCACVVNVAVEVAGSLVPVPGRS